jgi:hypothetical protein
MKLAAQRGGHAESTEAEIAAYERMHQALLKAGLLRFVTFSSAVLYVLIFNMNVTTSLSCGTRSEEARGKFSR